jgi:signal transduction histidine kinase
MRLLPRSLSGRILLAITAGAVATQIIALSLFLEDRVEFKTYVMGNIAAQRLANVIRVIDSVEGERRKAVVQALSITPHQFQLEIPWRQPMTDLPADAQQFLEKLRRESGTVLNVQLTAVRYVEHPTLDARFRAFLLPPLADEQKRKEMVNRRIYSPAMVLAVEGEVRLTDGAVLYFVRSLPYRASDLSHRLWQLMALWSLAVTLLVAWAVHRIVQPLKHLSSAALGLASNLGQTALDESGPTEVRQAAEAFNTMQQQMRSLIETRAQALSGISHDLRLPLTRMRLRIEQLGDTELRSKMEKDLHDMDAMVAGTLEFLRAGTICEAPVKTDLNALIDGIADDMRELGALIDIHGRTQDPVEIYPQAIRRCLTNLVDNARRHAGEQISICIEQRLGKVKVHVDDDGPGIPTQERERVFEPYIRLDPSRSVQHGGSGLGLAIARAIARTHGGDISITDRGTCGLRVTLEFPVKRI